MNANVIEVSNLSKSFNDFKAVNKISFSVEKGEVFGFLGPNGAGKTTTINMLTGLARPTSGMIDIAGQDGTKSIKKVQQLIGIVPDENNLYADMSGFDNLVFCASLYGMDKVTRESRAKQLLDQFGLSDTGKRPFKAFSKGMKRKLTIAAGIIHEPEILFLDEPTTGIDVESTRRIRKLIQELNNKGTTIFLTTHHIEEAERLCHRIGFIVDGKIIKVGRTSDLLLEAQEKNIVEFSIENNRLSFEKDLTNAFPYINVHKINASKIRIISGEKVNLMPFMNFFDERDILVREAKIIHPSLEEVFVKITGIEIDKMKKEKEGSRNE